MKRMWDVNELIKLIRENRLDPSTIQSGDIPQDGVLGISADNEVVKCDLFGKYVRIVNASDIPSPLTQEWIDIFKEGCFVNGDYLKLRYAHRIHSRLYRDPRIVSHCGRKP